VTALWSIHRVFWLFYSAASIVAVGSGWVSAIYLLRYAKQP